MIIVSSSSINATTTAHNNNLLNCSFFNLFSKEKLSYKARCVYIKQYIFPKENISFETFVSPSHKTQKHIGFLIMKPIKVKNTNAAV